VLLFAQRNVTQRRRREQLLDLQPPVGQAVLLGCIAALLPFSERVQMKLRVKNARRFSHF